MRSPTGLPVLLLLIWLVSLGGLAQTPKPPLDPIWQGAEQEVDRDLDSFLQQHRLEQEHGYFHSKIMRGDPTRPQICLTFDDGPHPLYTQAILDILRLHHVKATFFVVGRMAAHFPELLKAIAAEGHQIANHTYHHRNLTRLSDREVAAELQSTDDVVGNLTGKRPAYYRPPGGQYDTRVADVAYSLGYTLVLWTDDPGDWAHPDAQLLEKRTLDHIQNGGIILLHDGISQTLQILPELLERLKKRGFEFVTVEQLMGHPKTPGWFQSPPT